MLTAVANEITSTLFFGPFSEIRAREDLIGDLRPTRDVKVGDKREEEKRRRGGREHVKLLKVGIVVCTQHSFCRNWTAFIGVLRWSDALHM
jgi:hypothetical protein